MATLKVVGQHKGTITLNLHTATVLDLKNAVSSGSGLPVAGLKLLAGETRGPAEASVCRTCGVLRRDSMHDLSRAGFRSFVVSAIGQVCEE